MSFEPWMLLLVIAVLILTFGIYVLRYRKERLTAEEMIKIRELWSKVQMDAKRHPEQAVMKADKLLGYALDKAGYRGTMAEKMKAAAAVFRDNDGLWSAHKLRNRLAHDVDAQLTPQKAKAALMAFKKALYDLGISL